MAMTKAIIRIGYDEFVVEARDALTIHEILGKAEHYHKKYRSRDDGGPLFYVWEQDASTDMRSFEVVPDNLYRMAKLAGKPEDK
jgi:hypothetical protein